MSPIEALRAAAAGRDPETLVGPLFFLFTRLAAAGPEARQLRQRQDRHVPLHREGLQRADGRGGAFVGGFGGHR